MPSKQEKFSDFKTLSNTLEFMSYDSECTFEFRGCWNSQVFLKPQPITLELGCGRGEYTLGLALLNPSRNYIGIDLKSNRMWTGAQQATQLKLPQVRFLRSRIDYIDRIFSNSEVDELWIPFPDPQPQKTRSRKRLTHPLFLEKYKRILSPGARLHLKTDSAFLYHYTLEVLHSHGHTVCCHTPDIALNPLPEQPALTTIKTYYEQLFQKKGATITYIQFQLRH